MRKEVGWKWYQSKGLALIIYSRREFFKISSGLRVRGLKVLSEPCFYYFNTIIVSKHRIDCRAASRAQVWDFPLLRFLLFLNHKASLGSTGGQRHLQIGRMLNINLIPDLRSKGVKGQTFSKNQKERSCLLPRSLHRSKIELFYLPP
jgi:hypothetical protein